MRRKEKSAYSGVRLYAEIMFALKTKPRTMQEILVLRDAPAGSWTHYDGIITGLWRMGIVHVCEWRRVGKHGLRSRVFAEGPGPDAPYPDPKPPRERARRAIRPNLYAFGQCWLAMRDEAHSVAELCELSGMWQTQLYPLIRYMRRHGLIHLRDYGEDGRTCLWKLGQRTQASRPRPQMRKVLRNREWRAREAATRKFAAVNAALYRMAA